MKYFRYYPWWLQMVLFLLMVFTMMSSGGVILSSVLTKITGFSVLQLEGVGPNSPTALINAAMMVQGLLSIFIFLLPPLLFAYLSTPRPGQYLGLKAPGRSLQILLVILVMLGAAPILQFIEGLIGTINFGPKVKAAQEASENMTNAFLSMSTFSSFIKVFFIMAIIPAFGEELFFRGVLLRFAKQRSRNMTFPILFTAAVFSYTHSNIYGYLSIFLAGILLAVIYNLTGSIWCSIVGHLSFNGMQVILTYMGTRNAAVKTFMASNSLPAYLVAGGIVIFAVTFYLLWKYKTPLPPNWSDNFTPQELSQNANELN